jgi:hypothetical protein
MPIQNMPGGCAPARSLEGLPAQNQAQQVNGIEAREARFPEADLSSLPFAGAPGVVIGQHEAGEHDEEADREIAGVDDRRQRPKPVWIGEMEEDDIQGCETAQTCQCIQPGWFLGFHLQLDAGFAARVSKAESDKGSTSTGR